MSNDKLNNKQYKKQVKGETLKMVCLIVNRDHTNYYTDKFIDLGISEVYNVFSSGTVSQKMRMLLGLSDDRSKSLIIAFVKQSLYDKVIDIIKNIFSLSKAAKGVAFTIPIKSMVGVTMYHYLINKRGI